MGFIHINGSHKKKTYSQKYDNKAARNDKYKISPQISLFNALISKWGGRKQVS